MQHRVGVVRLQVAAHAACDVRERADEGALVHPHAPRHQPVRELEIHAPAEAHAIDRQHLAHELLRRAVQRVRECLHGRMRRVQQRGLAPARDSDKVLGKPLAAADTLALQPEWLAVDAHLQLDGLAAWAGHERVARRGVEAGGKRPGPRLPIERHLEAFTGQRVAGQGVRAPELN